MHSKAENPYNPLISFSVLVVSTLFALIPYLSTVAMYGTFNSEKWHAVDASSSIMLLFVLAASGGLFYVIREYNLNINGKLHNYIDIYELAEKPYLDYLLAHYGYVASSAAFCAAIVYVSKALLPVLGVSATALFMSVTVCFVFLVYGLVFAKAVWGVRRRRWPAFLMLLPIVFLDVTLIQMAIDGAGSLYSSKQGA
ncbi:MAG: hypothetical protein V7751_02785 [Pseudoalteromonas distincta]